MHQLLAGSPGWPIHITRVSVGVHGVNERKVITSHGFEGVSKYSNLDDEGKNNLW